MLPNLIHPVPIIIQRLDTPNTVMDEEYREPVQKSARQADTTVQGQAQWARSETMMVRSRGGRQLDANGYVLFRYADLEAAGITLQENDRFIKIGNEDTDVYIISLQPMGHYPSASGATLVKAYFADRQPARQGLGL